jgi:hypothetical protein
LVLFEEAANVEDTLIRTNTNNPPLSPLSSSCSGEVDESSIYISPYELNANSISDIKTFKPSYQLSFHRRVW